MKISVITPVYNRPREVAEAIRSALDQTLQPHEILVIDDGSEDSTAKAVEGFGPPVRLIRQDNQGPAAARNRAAAEAQGDWLALLDSDDLWRPGKLEAQAAAVKDNPAAGLVHTNGWVILAREAPEALDPDETHFSKHTPARGPGALAIYLSNPVITSSVMIRKQAFDEAGGFDESFRINEDADLFVRIMAAGYQAVYVPEPLAIQRVMGDGIARSWMAGIRASIRLQKKALALFPERRALFRAALAMGLRRAAQCAIAHESKGVSIRYWLESFIYRRPNWKELAVAALLIGGGKPGKRRVMRHWSGVIEYFGGPAGPGKN